MNGMTSFSVATNVQILVHAAVSYAAPINKLSRTRQILARPAQRNWRRSNFTIALMSGCHLGMRVRRSCCATNAREASARNARVSVRYFNASAEAAR